MYHILATDGRRTDVGWPGHRDTGTPVHRYTGTPGPSRFLPIFASRGGPGSAARCGGGPRGTQKLIRFFFSARLNLSRKYFGSESLATTSRKPPENLCAPRIFGILPPGIRTFGITWNKNFWSQKFLFETFLKVLILGYGLYKKNTNKLDFGIPHHIPKI